MARAIRLPILQTAIPAESTVQIFGIPVSAFIITLLMCDEQWPLFFREYAITLCYVFLCWRGSYIEVKVLRNRYPLSGQAMQRWALMLVITTLYTLVVTLFMTWATRKLGIAWNQNYPFLQAIFINWKTSMAFTLLGCAGYEIAYLLQRLVQAERMASQLEKQNLQTQLSQLKTQIQPHFLFNNFSTLAGVIEENPPLATVMVEHLARFYRYVLTAGTHETATLGQELECLRAYAFLLQIRHGDDLIIDLDPRLETDTAGARLPSMALQTMLENAVKHNSLSALQPMVVRVSKSHDNLIVSNRIQPRDLAPAPSGTGLENLRLRYALMGQKVPTFLVQEGFFVATLPLIYQNPHGLAPADSATEESEAWVPGLTTYP